MKNNPKHIPFLLNSIDYFSLLDDLRAYLNETSIFLDEKHDQMKVSEPNFEEEQSEFEYAFEMQRFEHAFPVFLSNSFIIVLVSILEEQLKAFCHAAKLVMDSDQTFGDRRESLLEQFKRYVRQETKLPIQFGDSAWRDLIGLFEVRHVIVHNSGLLNDPKRLAIVKQLSQRYPTLNITSNRVRPTIPFCNQMVQLVYEFLDQLKKTAYEHYR
jgi:hypothetical protein